MNKLINRSSDLGKFVPMPDDELIVCRCEEITKGEIRRAVHEGFRSLTEIKRVLRNGMGLCQGQTCARLVRAIVARELGVSQSELPMTTNRSPARPVEMSVYAKEGKCNDCDR